MSSDLIAKTHTIMLIDYSQKMVVPFFDVREVSDTEDTDQTFLSSLSRNAFIKTFLLSGYIGKSNLTNELVNILCYKHYKYRKDFEVGGVQFISLFDIDNKIIDHGIANAVDIATMVIIANNMSSAISLNNKNDIIYSSSILNKFTLSSPKSQYLDNSTLLDIAVTRFSISNNLILLTVRTIVSIL